MLSAGGLKLLVATDWPSCRRGIFQFWTQNKPKVTQKESRQRTKFENNLWFYGLLNSKDIRNELFTLCLCVCVRVCVLNMCGKFCSWNSQHWGKRKQWKTQIQTEKCLLHPVTKTNSVGIIAILISCLRTGLLAYKSHKLFVTNHCGHQKKKK